jgi:hypothetical protein
MGRIAMNSAYSNAIAKRMRTQGIGRRSLAKGVGGSAVVGLLALLGFWRTVAARQGAENAHSAIAALRGVLEDAAATLDVPVTEIAVQRLEAMDWPNGCLGLARADEVCSAVITPGYQIVLETPASRLVYRTDQQGAIRREAADDQESLRVRYEVSGGIAGIHDVYAVDAADLSPALATELWRLIEEAKFWDLPAQIDDGTGIDDGFWYHVTVNTGRREHRVSLINTLGPADSRYPRFWDLLSWLNQRMKTSHTGGAQTATPGAGHDALRVHYNRSGGIAGDRRSLELDTASLVPADVAELQRLVAEADFWNLPEEIDNGVPYDDGYEYQVSISEGNRSHTVSSYDGEGSGAAQFPGFWNLLGWLNQSTWTE